MFFKRGAPAGRGNRSWTRGLKRACLHQPEQLVPDAPEPVLLALETATDRCGVALMRGDRLLVAQTIELPRSHAEWLAIMIADALRYARLEPQALDAIAVSMGPGSYTGLRIGVSAAKGLCFATGAVLLGVPTLEAIALGAIPFVDAGDGIAVALNSRREEVYLALFEARKAGVIPRLAPAALSLDEAVSVLSDASFRRLWVAGEGAPVLALHPGMAHREIRYVPEVGPSPVSVARAGLVRYRRGAIESMAEFEPFYLKDFIPREKSGTAFDRLSPGRE